MKFTKKKLLDFTLVILIFACTGSTAVVVSGYVMNWLGAERWSAGYILGYIFIIFPIYHVLLLAFAFLFGRFDYFFKRIKKLFRFLNQKNTGIN